MLNERPSPFTLPPIAVHLEDETGERYPVRALDPTLGRLIDNLTAFAVLYESIEKNFEANIRNRVDPRPACFVRDQQLAKAEWWQRCFHATPGNDRLCRYVLSNYGLPLTIGTANRFLGDLMRICDLPLTVAQGLTVEEALNRLDEKGTPLGDTDIPKEQAERVRNLPPVQCRAVQQYLTALAEHKQLEDAAEPSWPRLYELVPNPSQDDPASWERTVRNGLKAAGIPTFARPGGVKSRSAIQTNGVRRKKSENR